MDTWYFSAYTLLTVAAALLSAALSLVIWRRGVAQDNPSLAARLLLLLVGDAALWALVYAAEIAAVPPDLNFLLNRLKYVAIVSIPIVWLLFSLAYAGHGAWIRRGRVAALMVMPLITLSLIWTNQWHGLIWAERHMAASSRFPSLEFVYGTWFWVHTAYSYLCFMAGAILIGLVLRRSRGVLRRQALVMLIGAAAPFASNAVSLSGLTPVPELDLTPIAFTVTSALFSLGLFRLRLLDLVPQLRSSIEVASAETLGASLAELRGRILEILLVGTLGLGILAVVLSALEASRSPMVDGAGLAAVAFGLAAILVLKLLPTLPYVVRAGGQVLALYALGLGSLLVHGLEADAGVIFFAFVISALVLFNLPIALIALGASATTIFISGGRILFGAVEPMPLYLPGSPPLLAAGGGLVAALTAIMLLGAQAFIDREMRRLIRTSQDLSANLEAERRNLEQRVAERTRLLEASNEASRQIAEIANTGRLLDQVAAIVRDAFDYYYVQVYLLDANGEYLQLVSGTGEAGEALRRAGHRLPRHQGLVGRAVASRGIVATGDVTQRPDWLPNRRLPATRSESAVPLIHDGEVLGVLDVQQDRPNGIADEETQLLAAIADQVAAALANARSLEAIEQQAEQQVAVKSVVEGLEATTTMEEALRVVVAGVARALGAPGVQVALLPGRETPP